MQSMQTLFTRIDYERLPEGFPAQLVEGQLVREPAPLWRHESVRVRLLRALLPLVEDDHLGVAPIDVLVDEHNVYQPDIAVLGSVPDYDTSYVGTPLAVFEILSPSTASHDRDVKTPRLLELGVREVWLVDPGAGTIECHTAVGVRSAHGTDSIASDVVPGFRVSPFELLRSSRPR